MRNVIFFITVFISLTANADIYRRVIDSNGTVLYTNKPPKNKAEAPIIKTAARPNVPSTGYFYKYKDNQQNIIYTDKPRNDALLLSKTKVTVPAKTLPNSTMFANLSPNTNVQTRFYNGANKWKFNNLIAQAAARHQVDEKLLHAVIQTESAYNASAVSSAGARGLMQLMPATASRFGVVDITDPQQNIDGGTRYLRHLMNLFPHSLDLAIAAYNAGENSVIKYNNSIPPYPETQNYVRQVLALYKR